MSDRDIILEQWPRLFRFWHIFSTSSPISFGWCMVNMLGVYIFMYPNLLHMPLVSHQDTNKLSQRVIKIYRILSYWDFIPIRGRLLLFLGFYMVLITGFVIALYSTRLMFKKTFIYYLRVGIEVILPIFMIITLQNLFPVIDSYRNSKLEGIYVIILILDIITSVIIYTIHNFLSGQSIYVPTNFLAIWDTWNMYSKYILPCLVPSILLINNIRLRNSAFCLSFLVIASSNILMDTKLPYLSRSSGIFYFILEQIIVSISVIAFFILWFDQSFQMFLVIFIPVVITIILNIANFYNYCTKKINDYLEPKEGESIDEATGYPLRFLEDTYIVHALRFLASNDGEAATKLAHFLMLKTKNKRIHIEGIRILIILDQKSDEVVSQLLKMTMSDIPWFMPQCLCDSHYEALAYLSKFVLFDSVKEGYQIRKSAIMSTIVEVVDKITEEDFTGCYSKAIDYLHLCEELENFIDNSSVIVTGCPEFYSEVAKYYETLRGDSVMAETFKYRCSYIISENKKVKSTRAKMEQRDMTHFISYRSRISSLTQTDTSQNPKLRIQTAVNELESKSVINSKKYFRTILLIAFLSIFFFSFSITMISKKRDHTLLIHKILMSRMIPLYRLSYKLAQITNNSRTNYQLNKMIYQDVTPESYIIEISQLFSNIEDIFIISKKYSKTYEMIVSEEKKYQIKMYQISKILDDGIKDYEVGYLYKVVHDVDTSIEQFVDCILLIRRAMDKIYIHICLWIPLINILITILCVIMICREFNTNFSKEVSLIWNILQEKEISSLERYQHLLMYTESNDILLSDEEIEEDNLKKIEIAKNEKTRKQINYLRYFSLFTIIFLVIVLVLYEQFLNSIIASDFLRNRSAFQLNRLYQNLLVIATDIMMHKYSKDIEIIRMTDEKLLKDLELAKRREEIKISGRNGEGIFEYLEEFENWFYNGKKIDDSYITIVKAAFMRTELHVYSHLLEIWSNIEKSIKHMTHAAYFLNGCYILIFLLYCIVYSYQKRRRSKFFMSLKALVQILPSQHITPQSQLLMTFSDVSLQVKRSVENKVVIRNYPDAIMSITCEGTIESVNKAMESLVKIDRHLLIGHKASELIEDIEMFFARNNKSDIHFFNTFLLSESKIPISVTSMFIDEKVGIIVKDRRNEIERANHLRTAKIKVEKLLSKILPRQMKIKILGKQQKMYSQVDRSTIIFIGISDFLGWCKLHNHHEIMELLDVIFSDFDEKINKYSTLTKLKTINETYMVASGLFESKSNQENEAVSFCIECARSVRERNKRKKIFEVSLNIGINTGGPVITGILGDELPMFDIWGDAVNVASRLETSCPPNFIQLSEETKSYLQANEYGLIPTNVHLKGKGKTVAYRIPI